MADRTLIVTLPDGTTATRTTARTYVAAVVARHTEAEAEAAATDAAQLQRLERLGRRELGAHLGIPVVVAEAAPEDTATLVATCPECHHPRGVRGDTLQDLSPGRYTEDSADGLAWARCYCACHGEG